MNCSLSVQSEWAEKFDNFKASLPDGYEYHFCSFTSEDDIFSAKVCVAVNDIDGAKRWLHDQQELAKVTWRIDATKPESGRVNVFKTYYRCQHNTKPRHSTLHKGTKDCKCPARLTLTLKKLQGKHSRAKLKDPHLPSYPMVLEFRKEHNHNLISADCLKHRDVGELTITKFRELYTKGHSPTSALNTHKVDLQQEYGDDYVTVVADRRICPDLQFCYRLYRKIFEKAYGAPSGDMLLHDLETAVARYNTEEGTECAKMSQVNDKLVIAVCTPLMQRIHRHHRCSGELVFVDSSGGMDRYDCRVFLLMTHSAAGGLPLGCIITTSESQEAVTLGLRLYNELIPSEAFFGRGPKGPEVFLTDDCDSERQSLHDVYPEATTVLCIFHILQAVWRFLWDRRTMVKKEDRPHLFALMKSVLFSSSEDDLEDKFHVLCSDGVAQHYSKYTDYCMKQYERRTLWAICFRKTLPMRGNDTNNFVESAMRVLKDQIFERVRAYNPTQLFDFLITRLPSYYERRLIDLANGRIDVTVSKRFMPGGDRIPSTSIKQLEPKMFEVRSEKDGEKVYEVTADNDFSMCTCPIGFNGAPCKHQFAVLKHFGIRSLNFLPLYNEGLRKHLFFLATGSSNVPESWFQPLPTAICSQFVVQAHSDDGNHGTRSDEHRGACSSAGPSGSGEPSNLLETAMNSHSQDIQSLEEDVKEVSSELIWMLKRDPESFAEPIKLFIRQFREQKTDAGLISALRTFGKYAGAATSLTHRKKKRSSFFRRRGVMIKVQPTAVSRRVTALGGKRAVHTGRKRKVTDHEALPPAKKSSVHLMPKKRPRKAPHDLSKCVQSNENIGKNHASKW